jgi:hypothetical protein
VSKPVFVSYSHRQGEWVLGRLVPCLKAAGLEVLVDRERFRAGRPVAAEIATWQGRAEHHVLVLSPSYLASSYCREELQRALALDPSLGNGLAVPVLREDCPIPAEIRPALYADLRDDTEAEHWAELLRGLAVDLGCAAPAWLAARDLAVRHLDRGESVNLLVRGEAPWRRLLGHLKDDHFPHLGAVDLDRGAVVPRRGLVEEILRVLGRPAPVPAVDGEDLVVLDRQLGSGPRSLLALLHFDHAARRAGYGADLFGSFRHLVMDQRQLQLLIHSRTPFAELVPRDHPLSTLDLTTVELAGRA